jgi:hypothetical protein
LIQRTLRIWILIYLWGAFIEDTGLFILSWLTPHLWFHYFNGIAPLGLDNALLRRSGGQWLAFALAQGITLWRWKKAPVWLAVEAGVRFSDLFTDMSYIMASRPALTTMGWMFFLPPFFLNLLGVAIMLRGYQQMMKSGAAGAGATI